MHLLNCLQGKFCEKALPSQQLVLAKILVSSCGRAPIATLEMCKWMLLGEMLLSHVKAPQERLNHKGRTGRDMTPNFQG